MKNVCEMKSVELININNSLNFNTHRCSEQGNGGFCACILQTVKRQKEKCLSLKVNLSLRGHVISIRHRRRGFLPTAELFIVQGFVDK